MSNCGRRELQCGGTTLSASELLRATCTLYLQARHELVSHVGNHLERGTPNGPVLSAHELQSTTRFHTQLRS